jgi:hypothetical protein
MEPRIEIDQSLIYEKPEPVCYVPGKEKIRMDCAFSGSKGEPVRDPLHLLDHELAHILEMSQLPRLLEKDFGIKEFIPVSRTRKSLFFLVLREVRVRAIQSRLMNKEKIGDEKINGPIFLISENFKFGRFSNKKELEQYAYELYDRTYAAWTEERIRFEWNRRLEFIRNWMESKET